MSELGTTDVDGELLVRLARDVGQEAAQLVRDRRPASGHVAVADTKSSSTDVVTQVDRASEELIRARLLTARPDDGFLGEEDGGRAGTSGIEWVVDPIDGTVNFVYGIPAYAVAIAARAGDVVQVGYVTNVVTGEEWGAVRGAGSWRWDGDERVPLQGPTVTSIDQALVGTGFSYDPTVRARQAAAWAHLLPQVRDLRRIGAAALDLVALAEGRLDAYVEQGLKPWDLAAGGLIAQEAGLLLSGLEGGPDERLVMAAPGAIAGEYFPLVRACGF